MFRDRTFVKMSGGRGARGHRGAWRQVGVLAASSRDLKPIEGALARLQTLVRKAAPRIGDALWNTIGNSMGRFGPTECRTFFAGYGRSVGDTAR